MGVWDKYEKVYEKLWVQKFSLGPTRKCIINELKKLNIDNKNILDMGCGTGQLLSEIKESFPKSSLVGVEPSKLGNVAREKGLNIHTAKVEDFKIDKTFDVVCCTHSFPYYKDQEKSLELLLNPVKPGGKLFLAHASNNTLYDKLALAIVKLTTSKAYYPSEKEMLNMIKKHTSKVDVIRVNAKYIPSIQLFVIHKMEANNENTTN